MDLSKQTEKYIQSYLQTVRADPQHYLDYETRDVLFEQLEAYNGVNQWLAILTVKKALPVWEAQLPQILADENARKARFQEQWGFDEGIYYSFDPVEMLELAESFLQGKVPKDIVEKQTEDKFFYGIQGAESLATWPVFNVVEAAYGALRAVLYGDMDANIVECALISYAGIDPNPPGVWNLFRICKTETFQVYLMKDEALRQKEGGIAFIALNTSQSADILEWKAKTTSKLEEYKHVEADLEKALEFWEWWLTEAIPQAFEMAQKYTLPQA